MIADIILAVLFVSVVIPGVRKAWKEATEADRLEALRRRGREGR